MNLRDIDLISVQEARQLIEKASEAQRRFSAFSQSQVDAIVDACALAAGDAVEPLARSAVEETGYGNVADKITKNRLAAVEVHRAIRGMKTVGTLREDREAGIVEVAAPVGVVAAIIPSTNPTSTAIYKTLIAIKAQNSIVLSPHPAAIRCICETVGVLSRAASKAGAPEGLIGCFGHPTTQGTQEMMRHRAVGVILATGGTGLVRAAYSSGKPAYGVGPGNVPSFIERTADVRKAVADIFAGKTFDYGTICSSEQAIVAEEAVREKVLEECRRQGAYFLTGEEIGRLGGLVFQHGTHAPNPKIVGRPATMIAEMAGIEVPVETRVLLAQLDTVGREQPLSAEKLSPILAFYSAANLAQGIDLCTRLLHFGGLGHTTSIHSQNDQAIREFGRAVPAFRVCVNTSAVHGSIGYSTNLFPAMTLGCGSPGGNITSDNIGPQHLMNVKRIAWESRPVEHRTIAAGQRMIASNVPETKISLEHVTPALAAGEAAERKAIAGIVREVLAARGIRSAEAERASRPAEIARATSPAHPSARPTGKSVEEGAGKAAQPLDAGPWPAPSQEKAGAMPSTKVVFRVAEFVSESDVRAAVSRREKIYIGPKTIVTPSARDLGRTNEIFVETEALP